MMFEVLFLIFIFSLFFIEIDCNKSFGEETKFSESERFLASSDPSVSSPGYFYIHELSNDLSWPYPSPNITREDCRTNYFSVSQFDNAGYGPLLDASKGLFYTWHYSLYSHILNRMLRSKRRTRNPNEATLFLIPFDVNFESSYKSGSCTFKKDCNADHINMISKYLSKNIFFQKNQGRDHLIIWNQMNMHPKKRVCNRFLRGLCKYCLSTSSWNSPKFDDVTPFKFFSMPMPSNFHYLSKEDRLISNIPSRPYPWENTAAQNKERVHLVSYIGSRYCQAPHLRRIKSAVAEFCYRDKDCIMQEMGHAEWAKKLNQVDAQNGRRLPSTIKNKNTITEAHNERRTYNHENMMLYSKSIFCLMPPGDNPGFRRGHFDALYLGCIPVTFHEHTLILPYTLHVNESELMASHITIAPETLFKSRVGSTEAESFIMDDRKSVKEHIFMKKLDYSDLDDTPGHTFMDTLRKLAENPKIIKTYQKALAQITPRLLYAIPPLEDLRKQDAVMHENRRRKIRYLNTFKSRPQLYNNGPESSIRNIKRMRIDKDQRNENNRGWNNDNRKLQQQQLSRMTSQSSSAGNTEIRQHHMEQITSRKLTTWDPEVKDAVDYMIDHVIGFIKKKWKPKVWADHPAGRKFYEARVTAMKARAKEKGNRVKDSRRNEDPMQPQEKRNRKRRPGYQRQRRQREQDWRMRGRTKNFMRKQSKFQHDFSGRDANVEALQRTKKGINYQNIKKNNNHRNDNNRWNRAN